MINNKYMYLHCRAIRMRTLLQNELMFTLLPDKKKHKKTPKNDDDKRVEEGE